MPSFISHSSKDDAIYSAVCLALDAAGIERWDPKSMSLGDSLSSQLQSAIRICEVCVLIATRHSVDSPWCLAELGAFWGAGKKVLMFMADADLTESMLPPQFKGTLLAHDANNLIDTLKKEIDDYRRAQEISYSLQSKEEAAIRLFYKGISEGIRGNDAGWEQAWNQCTTAQQQRIREFRPDVPSDASAATVLKPLYEDSSTHEVLHIGEKEQVSSTQAVYFVLYKQRKEVLVSRLHFEFVENKEVTLGAFYKEFSDPQKAYECILRNIGLYYEFISTTKSYTHYSPEQLKDEIITELRKLPLKRLFGGNLIYEMGAFFSLKRKLARECPRLDLFDIGYVQKVHLEMEKGAWRINRFENNSRFYVDVSR